MHFGKSKFDLFIFKKLMGEFPRSTERGYFTHFLFPSHALNSRLICGDRQKFCVKVNRSHPFRQVLDI